MPSALAFTNVCRFIFNLYMNKKLILGLIIVIIVIAIGGVVYWRYFQNKKVMKKEPSKEEITAGLSEFYQKDYSSISEKQSTYDCNLQVDVQTSSKTISIDSKCTVTPPYSAMEAFLAVARSNLKINGMEFSVAPGSTKTGLDWDDDEKEAVKKRLESIAQPAVAIQKGAKPPKEQNNLCFLPCVDDSPPASFEVLKVTYNPSREELSKLFLNYNQEKFKDLVINSTYSYKTHYKKIGSKIEWRYLLGQFETGKFDLAITFDVPVKSLTCERENIKTLIKIPSFDCKVTKLGEKKFNVKGFSTGLEKLVVDL